MTPDMDPRDTPVSHTDLYHKLGKLEGLMETMMASVSAFQLAIKDVHSRIDAIERRQNEIEKAKSSQTGATSALATLGKDFVIPVVAVLITWLVARDTNVKQNIIHNTPESSQHSSQIRR
jgi:hypothetical protein